MREQGAGKGVETSKVSGRVTRVGWRLCRANRTANLRQSPPVDEEKEKQKRLSARKGKGRGNSGPKQLYKDQTGNKRKIEQVQRKEDTTEREK